MPVMDKIDGLDHMIEEELKGFGFGFLQDVISLMDQLREKGIDLRDVEQYIRRKQNAIFQQMEIVEKKRQELIEKIRKCPECGAPLFLQGINASKGPSNIHGYKCMWFCTNQDCLFEEFSHESFETIKARWYGDN